MTGEINGVQYDKDTLLRVGFLKYEHTNGANFCEVNFIKRQNLFVSLNKKHWLGAVGKVGLGFVYPKTDTWLFGVERNDVFHVAGYVVSAEVGARYDFLKHFFAENNRQNCLCQLHRVSLFPMVAEAISIFLHLNILPTQVYNSHSDKSIWSRNRQTPAGCCKTGFFYSICKIINQRCKNYFLP